MTRPGGSRNSRNSGSEAGGGGKGGEGTREPPRCRLKWGTSPPPSLPGVPGFCDHRPSAASRRETQWKQRLLPPVLPRPTASRTDRSQGGLPAPMGGLPRTDALEDCGPLFHFPEAQGGTTARPHPWPPLHPCPAVGQDSGLLGRGASPRGAGGKAVWQVLPPLVLPAGRRGLVLAGLWGPGRPPSYRHRALPHRGLRSSRRCPEGLGAERSPKAGSGSRVTTPGPRTSVGPVRPGPPGRRPARVHLQDRWMGRGGAVLGGEAPRMGTPPDAGEGRMGLGRRGAEAAPGLQTPALRSRGRLQHARCPPADSTHR